MLSGDRELLESVIFDAKATQSVGKYWFASNSSQAELASLYGISMAFVSTRSGYTRWADRTEKIPNSSNATSQSDCFPLMFTEDLTFTDDFENVTCTSGA